MQTVSTMQTVSAVGTVQTVITVHVIQKVQTVITHRIVQTVKYQSWAGAGTTSEKLKRWKNDHKLKRIPNKKKEPY